MMLAPAYGGGSAFSQRTLALPTGLTGGDFAAMPRQLGERFGVTRSPASLLPALSGTQVDYWVDANKGNDANSGLTKAAPKKTIKAALNQTDVGTVWVAPGVYPYGSNWEGSYVNLAAADAAYSVRKWQNGQPGEVIIAPHQRTVAYSTSPVNASLHRTVSAFTAQVIDTNVRLADGSFYEYIRFDLGSNAANAVACAATPGSWYRATDVTHAVDIHPITSGVPTDRLLIVREVQGVIEFSRRSFYAEGLTFVGGTSAFIANNNTGVAGGIALFENCAFLNAMAAGLTVYGFSTAYASNCLAAANGSDGFQGFDSGGRSGDLIFHKCRSFNNGNELVTDTGNGFSVHNGSRCLLVDCYAEGSKGPQYADTDSTQSWWVGCEAGRGNPNQLAAFGEGFSVLTSSKGWAYRCVSTTNSVDFASVGTSAAYSECMFNTTSGTITTYAQT